MDAERRLLAAVLLRAWRDAQGRDTANRADALVFLWGPGASRVCDLLDLPVARLRERLRAV